MVTNLNLLKLRLDTSKLDKNFIAYETNIDNIERLTHNDVINDWHIEHIRRFNCTADYLIRSVIKMNELGFLLSKEILSIQEKERIIDTIQEHRFTCRNVCFNIDTYIEKIKTFCRYYFFMNKEKTDDGKEWTKALYQYRNINKWNYIESFINICKKTLEDEDVKFIINVRNKEIHNESPIDLMKYKFEGAKLIPKPIEYVILNDNLHNKIIKTIGLLISVTNSLQEILDNISPFTIQKYLEPQDGRLRNIIKMEERYKEEQTYTSNLLFKEDIKKNK